MFIASRLRLTLIIGGPIDTNTRIMYWKLQEKITKIAIFQQKIIFFEKFQKLYLDRNIGNKMYSFECCSDRDKPARQYDSQTGIAKNLDISWQKLFFWIFFVNMFVYMQKKFWFYLQRFFHNYSSKLLINVKENQEKGDNSFITFR